MAMDTPELEIEWRGRERYIDTWRHQLERHSLRAKGEAADRLILVEHEPVITLGRNGSLANLMITEEHLEKAGIDFHNVERGGDITYHGPGQLVGYPVISLRDRGLSVRDLMRGLEESLIRLIADFGITSGRIEGLTGVWHRTVDGAQTDEKLAALGVAVKSGVSYHGFALNVDPDLSHFQYIVPCGITGKQVASMQKCTERRIEMDEVRKNVLDHFSEVFNYNSIRQIK